VPQRPRRGFNLIILGVALVLLLIFSRSLASLAMDYRWWREMGQVDTWLRMSAIRYTPPVAEWLILLIIVWVAHARGMRHAGTRLREYPGYAKLATAVLAVLALILTAAAIDGWVIARYAGGSGLDSAWHDPAFGRSLNFYFFELPFYTQLIGFVELCAAAGGIVYYLTARAWQLKIKFPGMWSSAQIDWDDLRRLGRLETGLLKVMLALFLAGLAIYFWLGRYDLLYTDHGELMVGIDYVQQHVGLPLQSAKAIAAVLAAALVLIGRRRLAIACALVLVVDIALPPAISSLYVKPNELALEKEFIVRHIEATRSAYGLDRRTKEIEFNAHADAPIDFVRNRAMLDNVRLWDWRAFHDTLSQSQPLRPYAYAATDIDRYQIGGQIRQVLLAPRELDLTQLGDAQNRWINTALTFTHGYGLALAEASRITPAGLPELLIRNAPAEVLTPSLKLTRPEIYYGEESHEPVFARTSQPEFNYPSGSSDVSIQYDGHGGFPIDSSLMRFVAAWAYGD
jgi:uncharacterized membrane protein (UPF0182 family)